MGNVCCTCVGTWSVVCRLGHAFAFGVACLLLQKIRHSNGNGTLSKILFELVFCRSIQHPGD